MIIVGNYGMDVLFWVVKYRCCYIPNCAFWLAISRVWLMFLSCCRNRKILYALSNTGRVARHGCACCSAVMISEFLIPVFWRWIFIAMLLVMLSSMRYDIIDVIGWCLNSMLSDYMLFVTWYDRCLNSMLSDYMLFISCYVWYCWCAWYVDRCS